MKLTRLLLTLVCVFGIFSHVFSQSDLSSGDLRNVKIDAISDSDIKAYYDRATSSGISEDQVYQIVQQRGLPSEELTKLKQRVGFLKTGNSQPKVAARASDPVASTTNRVASPSTAEVPMATFKKDSSIFGSELFSASSNVFVPDLRIATPSNYVLGPDDELTVNVFGYSEQTYNLTVNREGNIYIPNVGPINVNGLSIEQASTRIKAKLASTIYRNINSGATKVQISLGKIRSIRATVIGEARKPGTFTVSSLTTLFNILYLCGGPSEMGSYRNIELIRGNQVTRKIDLYGILTNGDFRDNVLLEEGDVIRIPYYVTRATLVGQVKRPGIFEMKAGETFNTLLNFAGGFTDSAYRASVQIKQITDQEKRISDVPAVSFATYKPSGSDYITVGKILNRFTNRVSIAGAVQRPGDYQLEANMTVGQLIQKAGGLREDAYLERGVISRQNDDLTPSSVAFNVKDAINNFTSLPLKKEDVISVASITGLKDKYTVNIEGEVHAPGEFEWRQNLTVKDLILLAGGFTDLANTSSIEVSRRIKNANVVESQYKQSDVVRIDIQNGSLAGTSGDLVLTPFDIVVVRASSGYLPQRSVYINGQVLNPGRYVLQNNTQRISDMVERFGGFRSAADSNFITLRRVANLGISVEEKQRLFERLLNVDSDSLNSDSKLKNEIYRNYDLISINVKKAVTEPASTANIMLEDGDVITVERASNLIKVSGEVYYPTVIPFEEGKSLKYYINRSGSFTDNARKKGAMVIYPDGRAKSVGKFFFLKSYPSITPRSEIFVPAKSRSNRGRLSTGEWVAISSIFATLGTLVITAFRSN